jgi:hypothetical protein
MDPPVICFWKWIGWKNYKRTKNRNLESVSTENELFFSPTTIIPASPLIFSHACLSFLSLAYQSLTLSELYCCGCIVRNTVETKFGPGPDSGVKAGLFTPTRRSQPSWQAGHLFPQKEGKICSHTPFKGDICS